MPEDGCTVWEHHLTVCDMTGDSSVWSRHQFSDYSSQRCCWVWIGESHSDGTRGCSRVHLQRPPRVSIIALGYQSCCSVIRRGCHIMLRGGLRYNSSVVAAALGGMFIIISVKAALTVVSACIFTTVLTSAIGNFLSPTGMVALTFPAACTLIIFLTLLKAIPNGPIVVELACMTVPEDHLARLWLTNLVRSSILPIARCLVRVVLWP